MAIIYSYPTLPLSKLTSDDLLVITDIDSNNPTKSVTLSDLATYVTNTGTGTGTTNTLTLWTDGASGLLGDSILTQNVGATALTVNGNFITTGTGDFTGQVTIPTTPVAATDAASKNYVDTEVAGIPAGLVFKGNWNANLNSPALASGVGTVGNYYVVSVAGNTNLDGITDWEVGDWAVFVEVGGVDKWDKIDQTFISGNGAAGQVTFWNSINTVDGDNALYWDNVNKRLGISTTSPDKKLDVTVDTSDDGVILQTVSGRKTLEMLVDNGTNGQGKIHFYTGANLLHGRIMADSNGLNITQLAADKDIIFKADDGVGGTTEYFRLDGGNVNMITSVNNVFIDDKKLVLGSSADLEMFHQSSSSNSFIQNNTGNLRLIQNTNDGDITFESDDGSGGLTEYFRVDGGNEHVVYSKSVIISDSVSLKFGDGSDLVIQHNQGASLNQIDNNNFDLYIQQNAADKDIIFRSDDGSGGLATYFTFDGGDERMVASKNMDFLDNVKLRLGTGAGPGLQDLQIYHDGSNSYIADAGTGSLYITGSNLILQSSTNKNAIIANDSDSVELYYNASKKFETTSSGVDVTGTLDTDNLTIAGAQGSAGDVLTSSGTGVSWQAGGGGGGATDLNGLSDCLVDTDSLYVGEVPSGLSGNPQDNTILGIRAGDSLTSGDSNTLIGNNAGDSITTGTNSVAVGMDALAGISTVGNNVAIGKNAYKVGTAANNVYMGYDAGSAANTGSYQVGIGVSAGNSNTGAGTISMGWFANRNNTALGTTSIGYQAGYSHTSGTGGVNVGYEAGRSNTTGASRTMMGYRAGKSNTGGWNTFIGAQCGMAAGSGIMNVGIGSNNMGFAAMGNFNIALGHQAAQQLEGNENVIIGHEAGQYTSSVDDSVMVGFNAGKAITTGDQNTLIGSKAGYSGTNDLTTGADNVLIGFEAEASSATVSNEVNLYNGSVVARFQGAAAAWSFVSDARDKKDIEDLELGLDFVTKLKPRKFKWDLRNSKVDKNKNASGFVAQEVKEVLDEINADYTGIVDTNNSEQYTVSQSNIIPMLVNAVKELKEEIEQLKKS